MDFEEVHTDSQSSVSDQNEEQFSLSIFDVFNEIEITGDGNWMFGALFLGTFGDEEYHIMVRSMICDYIDAHRSRFKEFYNWRNFYLFERNEEAEVMGRNYWISGIQWTLRI